MRAVSHGFADAAGAAQLVRDVVLNPDAALTTML